MNAEYEAELRQRIELLKSKIADELIQFAPGTKDAIISSISAIRYDQNGQIDLSTVDGSVRAMAMAIAFIQNREDAKKEISLFDLQKAYFDAIDSKFGKYYCIMLKKNLNPHDVALSVSKNDDLVYKISDSIPDFFEFLVNLWESASASAYVHIEDSKSLKAVFGGDLFPSVQSNIASSCGVYIDTIILPDPFLRSSMILKSKNKSQSVYYLIKHALNLLKYKELALADINPPIVAVVPDRSLIDEQEENFLNYISEKDIISHISRLFGRSFSSINEAMEFVKPLSTAEQAMQTVKDQARILFDTDFTEPLEQQLQDYLTKYLSPIGCKHAGQALIFNAAGRMRQANDVLLRSQSLRGVPLIDAPTSWRYFQWKMEYSAREIDQENLVNFHLSKALQTAADGEMTWLGNVPTAALIEMRKVGAISELREILSTGVAEMVEARPSNFHRTGDQVIHNLQSAFDAHRKELSTLKGKKWRFAGVDLGTCIVRGAVEIASACGIPLVSLIKTAIEETIDPPKIREIPKRYRNLKEEDRKLKGSPVGLLFRHCK